MINEENFKLKLQLILDEIYPDRETYQKMSYYAVEPKVRMKIYKYVQETYASYYSDNLLALLKERDWLLEKCLAELGVTK